MSIRRLKAIITTAFFWGLAGTIAGTLTALPGPSSESLGTRLFLAAFFGAVNGLFAAASGAVFALLLMRMDRDATIERLSLTRVALLGALVGSIVPMILTSGLMWLTAMPPELARTSFWSALFCLLINGSFGASLAAGQLAIARRAKPDLIIGGAS